MNLIARLKPDTMEGQMIAIVAVSLLLLLLALSALDALGRDSPLDWAESIHTLNRLERMRTTAVSIAPERRAEYLQKISACHEGYTLSHRAWPVTINARMQTLRSRFASHLETAAENVVIGEARVSRADFAYGMCSESEIALPMDAVVVSVRLDDGQWLSAEVHPHEWHIDALFKKILRHSAAILLIGAFAIVLMRRAGKPLRTLTYAAQQFADGLRVSAVAEVGPPDVKRAISSFNAMQQQVTAEVKRRIDLLTAISHDLRTPLTALRIRTELLADDAVRSDLIASIIRMDRLIGSAIQFLRGESRAEPMREIDLSAMVASECSEFEEAGQHAEYIGESGVRYICRSEALARALRNLIENANKYGDGAIVDLRTRPDAIDITVTDSGPGIAESDLPAAKEPFRRLSHARGSSNGGFGLGLAIAEAIVKGHGGALVLSGNTPSGLVAAISLPRVTFVCTHS